MKQVTSRKIIARKRIRGLIIFLIVVLFFILAYDVFTIVRGWF